MFVARILSRDERLKMQVRQVSAKTWGICGSGWRLYITLRMTSTVGGGGINDKTLRSVEVSHADVLYTYESGRVVVTGGLSITIGFQNGISLNDLVFQGAGLES